MRSLSVRRSKTHDLVQGPPNFRPFFLTAHSVATADDVGEAVSPADPVQEAERVANVALAACVRADDYGERPHGQFFVGEVLEVDQPEVGNHCVVTRLLERELWLRRTPNARFLWAALSATPGSRATTVPPGCRRRAIGSRRRREVASRRRVDHRTPAETGADRRCPAGGGLALALTSTASRRSANSMTKSTSFSVVVRQYITSGAGTWPSRQTSRSSRIRFSKCAPVRSVVPPSQMASAGSLQ